MHRGVFVGAGGVSNVTVTAGDLIILERINGKSRPENTRYAQTLTTINHPISDIISRFKTKTLSDSLHKQFPEATRNPSALILALTVQENGDVFGFGPWEEFAPIRIQRESVTVHLWPMGAGCNLGLMSTSLIHSVCRPTPQPLLH